MDFDPSLDIANPGHLQPYFWQVVKKSGHAEPTFQVHGVFPQKNDVFVTCLETGVQVSMLTGACQRPDIPPATRSWNVVNSRHARSFLETRFVEA